MPRKTTKSPGDAKPAAKSRRSKAAQADDEVEAIDAPLPLGGLRPAISNALARRRGKAIAVLAVVGLWAVGAQIAWKQAAPIVAGRERYLVPAERITVTTPPEWIIADVRQQVIHAAGLDGRLSILDPAFVDTVQNAFTLHPWILRIDRIEKKVPPGVHLDVAYRRPVAVIEAPVGENRLLLPVDWNGIHLPTDDVPLIRRQYLPRITGIAGHPPVGQRWEDPRVAGAVELATKLETVWEALHLMEITPSTRPEILGSQQFFVYELVTRGGTRIEWGAAPNARAPGEAEFGMKLERLQQCVKQYGPLDGVDAPGSINVRGDLQVKPRMVKKPAEGKTMVK